jgi:hypothetical protein
MMENTHLDPLELFVGKVVLVLAEGCRIAGKLLDYDSGSENKSKPHIPGLLVLENEHGKLIIRGNWQAVGTFCKNR